MLCAAESAQKKKKIQSITLIFHEKFSNTTLSSHFCKTKQEFWTAWEVLQICLSYWRTKYNLLWSWLRPVKKCSSKMYFHCVDKMINLPLGFISLKHLLFHAQSEEWLFSSKHGVSYSTWNTSFWFRSTFLLYLNELFLRDDSSGSSELCKPGIISATSRPFSLNLEVWSQAFINVKILG